MLTKYVVIFGVVFFIMHKIHSVNRRDFENFFGEDIGRIASHFRWDTEKADRLVKEKFGSTLLPTASVTSGFSNNELIQNSRPKVFERLSVNNKKADKNLKDNINNRLGSVRPSLIEKMYPVKYIKLNKKIKKCKREAELIGGRKGRELFQACKKQYNRLLNKTNTEEYVNTYIGDTDVTPSVADRYLRTDIVNNKNIFKNNKIRYLEGKDSKQLFRENFNAKKEHYNNRRNTQNLIIKRVGKIFRVTILIVTVVGLFYMTMDNLKLVKQKNLNIQNNIKNMIKK